MNRNSIIIILTVCIYGILIADCSNKSGDAYVQPPNTFSITGSVHEMNLYPDPPPSFPEHEGKAEFISNCAVCHTLKYITMQPDFSAKTWDAEVTKMVAKYHAHIDSVNAKKIVGYLVAVKGKK